MMVPAVPLGGGLLAPQLGLGTWELTGRACTDAVRMALEMGYRHVDTAEGYGNEQDIAPAIRTVPREELFVVSKVWRGNLEPDALRHSAEQSLRRLGTDYLDLLLIHWPSETIPLERTVAGFRELMDDGLVRGWGVSNFTARRVTLAAALGDPATNQVELHPYFNQASLVRACRAHGVPVTAYSPLAKGRVIDDPVLRAIGERHGASAAQVALRWIAQQGHVVIPKASSERHLRSNLAAFDFTLSNDELLEVFALPQGSRLVQVDGASFDD